MTITINNQEYECRTFYDDMGYMYFDIFTDLGILNNATIKYGNQIYNNCSYSYRTVYKDGIVSYLLTHN